MKKSLMVLMAVLMSTIIFAQSRGDGHNRHNNEEIEKMKTDLGLNDKQYAAIKSINKKYAEKDSIGRSKKNQEMKTLKQDEEKEIAAVLTPEQKAKWKTFEAARIEKRNAKMSEGTESQDAKMKSDLSLSDDQFEKIKAANKEFREKMMALKGSSDNKQSPDKSELTKVKSEHEAKVKSILSDEQFKKWSALRMENKDKHRQHGMQK